MISIKKWRGGPRAAEGSPAYRETNSSLTFYKTPRAAGEDGLSPNGDEQEADKHVWTWAWVLEGPGRSGGHYKMLEEVSLEQIPLDKNKSPTCSTELKGMWWSRVHLPVEMCPQDKTCWRGWQPCCIFSQNKKALSRLLRGLYFSPLNLVPPDEGWGTVAWVSSPVDSFLGLLIQH